MNQDKINLDTLRHSTAHIMAAAVKKLYPEAKFGIGPAIEDGFYYDFDIVGGVKEEDLKKIENLMKEIVKENISFEQEDWSKEKALSYFKEKGEIYKVELIEGLEQDTVSIYKTGDFVDLCKGPHVESSKQIRFFKLLSTSAAYWKGDENNAQLSRVYGTVFFDKKELKEYLHNLEEAKKRDHRILGKKLGLFDIYHDDAGAGLVFYLPKGAVLRKTIEDWEINEHFKRGYEMVNTPYIMHEDLWEKSGHLQYYKDFMYPIDKENQTFILKPMNCPGHILIYKSKLHSFRDLPLRMFELGTVHRYEKSGVLHGLLRVREFTQDDAHIFCTEEQLFEEIEGVLNFVQETMRKFGFNEFSAELSTRPEKFIGDEKDWELAEKTLEEVLKKKNIEYEINAGDGAFYGPKIDIKLKDALKRQWQCATVQLDYSLPKKFDLTYHDKDGSKKQVIMLHRVILGSVERFIATLTEHYAGNFPLWLAPVQVSVLSVSQETNEYAKKIKQKLFKEGIKVKEDVRDETLPKKIRSNEMEKIPYLLIVGKKEVENDNITVRVHGGKNLGSMDIKGFIEIFKKEVSN